jgi:membrane-bound ClpP family serine protease
MDQLFRIFLIGVLGFIAFLIGLIMLFFPRRKRLGARLVFWGFLIAASILGLLAWMQPLANAPD